MSSNHIANRLLVCTVGGSPDGVVACLEHWRPTRVVFITTDQTESSVDSDIVPEANSRGLSLDPGRYECTNIHDGQDLVEALRQIRVIEPEVQKWLARGGNFQVVVDFTAGTKCMSVALALLARRWCCEYSYTGGVVRTKDGVGTVVSGSEQIFQSANPWDVLGFQAVERFTALFDQRCFMAAASIADEAGRYQSDPTRKREFNALKLLADAYDDWDRFQHKSAAQKLSDLRKSHNDLRSLFPGPRSGSLLKALEVDRQRVADVDPQKPGPAQVVDLLANAKRRAEEGRLDDAVGRLYRCVELIAQINLADSHGIPTTSAVPIDKLPESLKMEWGEKLKEGPLRLGLQEAYTLLFHLKNPVGERFRSLGLSDPTKSPLVARNSSILAHGLQPVSEKIFASLLAAAKTLAEVDDLPDFPHLSN